MDQLFQFKEDQIEGAVAPEIDPFRTSMAEALNCAVCNEVFTDPHLLSCGHCFCGPCLFSWFRTKKSCPKCRLAVVKMPTKAFCIQNAAEVLCEHSPHISRSGNTEVIRRDQWRAFFAVENQAGYIVDTEDFVRRCITCAWEIGTDNMCHNCGAEYNSDPEYRDDTADDNSDNEPLDYENAFGVTVESQRNIYQDIQSRRSRGNNGLYEMEASDDDNVISDGSSENMNYRDEEDLEEFVVSDNHYESSVNGATSDYSSDEEQYALQAQQTVSLDSSDEEVQLERQSLGSGNDVCVLIDDEGDTIDSDDDDNAVSPPIIEELTTSSENDSAGEGPSTRMNNLSISSSNHSLLDLDTSSDDDNAGEGSSTGAINRRNKGKRVIRSISSDESDESGSSDDDDQREDDDKNNTNAMMDESKNKKEAYKTKVKKANKKRKRKGKGKAKPKKSKSN